jgi:hypothetical protein
MSIKVLKARAQSRRLVSEKNSVATMPVNLYYSGNSKLCCPTKNSTNPAGGIYVKPQPAPQRSYGNYNRQAMLGYSGLASRVVSTRDSQTNNALSNPESITFKRMPKFSQSQYLYNRTCEAVRCKDKQSRCSPVAPECYNNGDSCGKSKISITKDLGYLSQDDYLKRKIARRVKDTTQPFELPPAPAANSTLTC